MQLNYSVVLVSGIQQSVSVAAAAAKSLQSCPTLCDPIEGSPPGSPAPGILQARTLEWVAISFSNAWKWKVKRKSLSRVRLLATPWTAIYQAPPSMGLSRQEYWSGVPLPSPVFQLYIYRHTHTFSRHWIWFPVLYSKSYCLSALYLMVCSVYLLIPTSKFIPRYPFPFDSHVCFLSPWVYFCFINKFLSINFLRFHL